MATGTVTRTGARARVRSRVAGIAALLGARAADVAVTVPVLSAAPALELNPIARALGPEGYVLANLVAIALLVGLIEGAIVVDRHRNGRRSWRREVATRTVAYGWLVVVLTAVVVHNATTLAQVIHP
jgi:uncharacterized membrane protein